MEIHSEERLTMYRYMVFGRLLEEKLATIIPYWHASQGEEASLVGTFLPLGNDDYVSVHYRGVSLAYYMRGGDLRKIIAGHIGKDTSYSRGRIAAKTGPFQIRALGKFSGSLGTNLNMAAGVALAIMLRKWQEVVLVTFGDGTSSRGDFHEAINWSGVMRLPIVFVCQNNQWGSSLPFGKSTAAKSIADRAAGYGILGEKVDGNDVEAVFRSVKLAIDRARGGGGPTLIETLTYRMCGHNVADKEEYRTKEEVQEWLRRDPISRYRENLIKAGVLNTELSTQIIEASKREIEAAAQKALEDPWPPGEVLTIGGMFSV